MADAEAETTLTVNVSGEEGISRLSAALQSLGQQSASVGRSVEAGTAAAPGVAAEKSMADLANKATTWFGSLGKKLSTAFGTATNAAAKAPIDALRSSTQVVGRSITSLSGSLGEVASGAGITSTAIVAVGLGVTGLLAPVASLVAGFALLRTSFGWVQDAAQEQIRLAGRTAQFAPGAVGEDAYSAAQDEMKTSLAVTAALFGDAADHIQSTLTRKITDFRLGRGIRGEADIFSRWGITTEAIQMFQQQAGRLDVNKYLNAMILKREELERDLAQARESGTPGQVRFVENQLAAFADDTVKIFGAQFALIANTYTSEQKGRLESNLAKAKSLGAQVGYAANRRMIDFTISLESLKATFGALWQGVASDVSPSITKFMTELNRKLLDPSEGGEGLGRALRDLAATLADRAWEGLQKLMQEINVEKVNEWIRWIQKEWHPEETAANLKGVFNAIIAIGKEIFTLTSNIREFFSSIPPWITGALRSMSKTPTLRGELTPSPLTPQPPATFGERFGGGADFAPGGGGGGFGGGAAAPGPPPGGPPSTGPVSVFDRGATPLGTIGGPSAAATAPTPSQAAPSTQAATGPPSAWEAMPTTPTVPPPTAPTAPLTVMDALRQSAAANAISVWTRHGPGGQLELAGKAPDQVAPPQQNAAPAPPSNSEQRLEDKNFFGRPLVPAPIDQRQTPQTIWERAKQFYGFGGGETAPVTPPTQDQTYRPSFADTFNAFGGGGVTAQDGANFGTAAAQSLIEGLDGVHIPYGSGMTSYGTAPNSAPKDWGGDTPSES